MSLISAGSISLDSTFNIKIFNFFSFFQKFFFQRPNFSLKQDTDFEFATWQQRITITIVVLNICSVCTKLYGNFM
jgi:hypothetical protein